MASNNRFTGRQMHCRKPVIGSLTRLTLAGLPYSGRVQTSGGGSLRACRGFAGKTLKLRPLIRY